MRTQQLLLLGSLALSGPALAAEPKPAAHANAKPGEEAIARADAARSAAAGEEPLRNRPSGKNRVHYTFPPSAKRM